ncbi:MAG: coenzyme F420-0:L-glutamate ligase [Halieaceae bacterium]|nr:coenzyme F420-0:L-glutamate ligase [Halieaceae bacterium]
MIASVQLVPVLPFPLVEPGDDLAAVVLAALADADIRLAAGDVLVLAQKVVSKAEGRYVTLSQVEVGDQARELAQQADKEPALAQLILDESREVLRVRPGVIIVEHRLGYVHANAGIDRSNLPGADDPAVLLLPEDPDSSAAALRAALEAAFQPGLAVIINDSAGRAWRQGTEGFALGCSGIEPVEDQVGRLDLFGRPLEVTEVAVADEMAAAASLLMGQADQGCPAVVIRGARWQASEQGSTALLRPREMDMFR